MRAMPISVESAIHIAVIALHASVCPCYDRAVLRDLKCRPISGSVITHVQSDTQNSCDYQPAMAAPTRHASYVCRASRHTTGLRISSPLLWCCFVA